jgi:hypothetical protein
MKIRGVLIVIALCALGALLSCSSDTKPAAPPVKPPDESAAVEALRQVVEAQTNFIHRTRRYAQTFDELIKDHLLNAVPKKADIGYDFLLLPSPDAESYTVTATPSTAGARYFFADQTGVLRAEKDKPATSASPEL